MYQYRSRDRRLMEQTARNLACILQRDYSTFNLAKKTTTLSNRVPFFSGYVGDSTTYPNIGYIPGSEVDNTLTVLYQLLENLSVGTYQQVAAPKIQNPGIWPPSTAKWGVIFGVYAAANPAYLTWLNTNNIAYVPFVP